MREIKRRKHFWSVLGIENRQKYKIYRIFKLIYLLLDTSINFPIKILFYDVI